MDADEEDDDDDPDYQSSFDITAILWAFWYCLELRKFNHQTIVWNILFYKEQEFWNLKIQPGIQKVSDDECRQQTIDNSLKVHCIYKPNTETDKDKHSRMQGALL